MPKKSITREHRIYLAIWRKAWKQRDDAKAPPVYIYCSTKTVGIAMRLGMYRAIRPYRNGELFDEELAKAAEFFVATLAEPDNLHANYRILLKRRETLNELEKSLSILGLDEEDLKLTEEKLLNAELETLMDKPQMPMRPANPFFER